MEVIQKDLTMGEAFEKRVRLKLDAPAYIYTVEHRTVPPE